MGSTHTPRRRALHRACVSRIVLIVFALASATGTLACARDNDNAPTTARTDGTPAAESHVPTGVWGGDGIMLRVTETGATVEFDCAVGTITEPLRTDPEGHFEAEGLYSGLSGGPIEVTPAQESKPSRALYKGSTDGSTMTLAVVLTKTGEQLDRFRLGNGRQPHLERCL